VIPLVLCVATVGCGGGASAGAPTDGGRSTTPPARSADDADAAVRAAYLRVFQDANGRLARDAPSAQQRLLDADDAESVRSAAREVRRVTARFADDLDLGRPPATAAREHRRVVTRTRELAAAYVPLHDGSTERSTVGPDAPDDPALRRIARLGDLWQSDLGRLGDAVARRP
jgi:hypothetical protein